LFISGWEEVTGLKPTVCFLVVWSTLLKEFVVANLYDGGIIIMNYKKFVFGCSDVVGNLLRRSGVSIMSQLRNKALSIALTGLGLLGTTSLYISEAKAAPDPVFKSILQDIRNQLPRGMVMRLPSVLKLYNPQGERLVVYPDVEQRNRDSLNVILYSQPNCGGGRGSRSCFFGRLSVSQNLAEFENGLISKPLSNQILPGYRNRVCGIVARRNVTLTSIVKAISVDYDTCGASSGRSNWIIWQQNGLFFLVVVSNESVNIDIATSMASEPPISSGNP